METVSKYRIVHLNLPVGGFNDNLQILRSVDGGQTYYHSGEGGYFNTVEERDAILDKYNLSTADNIDPFPYKFPWEYTEEELANMPEIDYSDKNRYPHGAIIGHRMEAYHDITVYEDGYEESYYIGD